MLPRPYWPRALPALALIAAAAVCYGGHGLLDLGFYHDDWFLLARFHFAADSFMGRIRAIAAVKDAWNRPLNWPLWAGIHCVAGENPLPWQLALAAINAGAAAATGLVLRRFGAGPRLSLLGAILLMAYPSKDANLYWATNMINPLSLLLFLAAYLLQLTYVERGGWKFLAGAMLCYVLSLGNYDQSVLLFPIFAIAPGMLDAQSRPRALRGAVLGAACAAGLAAYKLLVVPWLVQAAFYKTVAFSPRRAVLVYLAGINASLGPFLLWNTAKSCFQAMNSSPLLSLAALSLPWSAWLIRDESPPPRPLLLLGGAIFILGYLPLTGSDYMPTPINHQNRLNLIPAVGAAIALVGLMGARSGRMARCALTALAGVFLLAHVRFAQIWAESYRRQLGIKATVLKSLAGWPADRTLVLWLEERAVAGKAPVFDASWDITGATRVWTGDPSRLARVVSPRMGWTKEGIRDEGAFLPYSSLLFLDARTGTLKAMDYGSVRRRPPPL